MRIKSEQSFCVLRAFSLVEVVIALSILAIALSTLGSSIFSLNQSTKTIRENRSAVEVAQKVMERIQAEPWNKLGQFPATWHRREVETSGLKYVDELTEIDDDEFMHRPLVDEPAGKNLYEYLRYGDVDLRHRTTLETEAAASDISISDFTRDKFGLPFVRSGQKSEVNASDPDAVAPTGTLPSDIVSKYDTPERYNWLQFLGIMDSHSGLSNLRVYVEYYYRDPVEGVLNRVEFEEALDKKANQLPQSHALLDLEELDSLDAESVVIRVTVLWDRRDGIGTGRHSLAFARRE